MENNQITRIKLQSGCNVDLSINVHDDCFCTFDEAKYFSFSNIINSGLYFPQIMQFVVVLFAICGGHTSFGNVIIVNLLAGIGFTAAWFLLKLYKIPGINFISCFIGGNIFRVFLHFIVIALVSIFVIGEWMIILYCLLGGAITSLIKVFLFNRFSTVAYNDEVVMYVSKFKT